MFPYNKKFYMFILVLVMLCVLSTAFPDQAGSWDFPEDIDPQARYLFFLHGRIVEDSGLRPTSEEFGIYEYEKILKTFQSRGLTVLSEARQKGTNVWTYADKVIEQIHELLDAGVPPQHITVAGASKGGAIAVVVSSKLQNKDLNFVLIATCEELFVESLVNRNIFLTGRVLSIYDVGDALTGSCLKFFQKSLNSGVLGEHKEIALDMGNGHGFHYEPAREWIDPIIDWISRNKIPLSFVIQPSKRPLYM